MANGLPEDGPGVAKKPADSQPSSREGAPLSPISGRPVETLRIGDYSPRSVSPYRSQ